jgi:NAD(P)-dependent dehydrogenase (short-subunit alcohol dehydrogenase family)
MSFDVKGRVALVTGANRGIGREIVKSLVDHGAKKVYAAVRSLESAKPLVGEFGAVVAPIEVDLQKPETIEAAAKTAADVDLVINNAGVFGGADPFAADAFEKLEYELDVNLYGFMRVARAFAPVLKKNGGGALVQINSVVSIRSFPTGSTYSASKAASYSMTQAIRDVLQDQGTRVVSVHPGPIATDMATHAGITNADPPSVVAEGIVTALAAGEFHLFPDTMAKHFEGAYASYAKAIVEAPMMEG